ncbi:MAG: Uma2 family endonuclease [Myxococcales bacterium]|nr:Uma2 family endonuclease [Myxococcales bacterium]
MNYVHPTISPDEPRVEDEQRVVLHNVSWKQFEHWLRMRGDDSSVRIAYRKGELELMSPSREHEFSKEDISALMVAFARQMGLVLSPSGSFTMKLRERELGAEPDTGFYVGPRRPGPPDIVVEIIRTNPLLDKLAIYAGLGVRELWCLRRDGRFEISIRRGSGFRHASRSELVPELDFALLSRFVGRDDPMKAVDEYRAALGKAMRRRRS